MALPKPRCIGCLSETDLTRPDTNLSAKVRDIRLSKKQMGLLAHYEFDCVSCGRRNYHSADKDKIYMLMNECGVETALHPENPPGGPPLTDDDLLDLHELLGNEELDLVTLLRT